MGRARTVAWLAAAFAAGAPLGWYGAIPLKRALLHRSSAVVVAPPAAFQPALAARNHPDAVGSEQVVGASYHGSESRELHRLMSPDSGSSDESAGLGRSQPPRPMDVCGTGVDRRLCVADDTEGAARDNPDGNWMVGMRAPDLPITAGAGLQRFFRYLTESTRGRAVFRAWLKRSGRYHDVVARELADRGMPLDLEAVVFVESGYSPTAISSQGAVGLWQFMPDTARVYGLTVDHDYDERRSVEKATAAATRFLGDLYERFGSWELALAAYDMGYKRLVQQLDDMDADDYWALSRVPGVLPDETVQYVPRVLAVAVLLRNLDRFGFDEVRLDEAVPAENLEVPGGTPLRLVARAAGTSVDKLRALNPELLAARIPDRGIEFDLHVPARGIARARTMLPRLLAGDAEETEGVGDAFDWGSDELPPRRRAPAPTLDADRDAHPVGAPAVDTFVVLYRVDEGETLSAIARRFGVSESRIIADNHLDPEAQLPTGRVLELHPPKAIAPAPTEDRTLDSRAPSAAPRSVPDSPKLLAHKP